MEGSGGGGKERKLISPPMRVHASMIQVYRNLRRANGADALH
jgi:hypothetical protein